MTKLAVFGAILVSSAMQAPEKTALQRPAEWVTRADSGTDVSAPLYFVKMPPGWHITTGPGTILYNPGQTCASKCRIEAEIYLFPGQGEGGYGVFLGGSELDDKASPSYDVFMLRGDGAHARGNWAAGVRMPSAAFRPEMSQYVEKGLPEKPVKNVITIDLDEVDGARVARFLVNGQQMYDERHPPRDGGRLPYVGTVGLRVDAGVNIHVTRLEVVRNP